MEQTNILLETGTNELEIIEFSIDFIDEDGKAHKQSFGINVIKVREIIKVPKLTKLPDLPEGVCGIFNLRDQIIPALDLSNFLYQEERSNENRKMVVSEFNNLRFGFIVDEVYRIHRISWTEVHSPNAVQELEHSDSTIVGIVKLEDRNILMLDVESLVAQIDPMLAIQNDGYTPEFDGSKYTVMTVEDSSTIRAMIVSRLKVAGFKILPVHDGEMAWKKLQQFSLRVGNGEPLEDFVNLIITDIEMPRMDGYTLTKNIKSDVLLGDLPVVIFSSLVNEDVRHKGSSVGADAQLTKPEIGKLLDTVCELIQEKVMLKNAA